MQTTFSVILCMRNLTLEVALRKSEPRRLLPTLGFHRPLRVVPPVSSPRQYVSPYSPYNSAHLQQQYYHTEQFPSHFYPEKLYQYWQYYYPRAPGWLRPQTQSSQSSQRPQSSALIHLANSGSRVGLF